MTKTETYCDICGEKINPFEATRLFIHEWERHEMDLCKSCTTWLLDLIADRQVEKTMTFVNNLHKHNAAH